MESEARIEEIIERSGKKARIRISRKLFHPSGGGQPGDSGHIEGRGFRAEVVDSHAGADGDILEISVKEGDIPLGGTVLLPLIRKGIACFQECIPVSISSPGS